MRIDGSARNEELTNFLEAHPNAKLTNIPITPALREKVLGHVEAWQRSNPSEVAKVRSILSADTLPPPIVQFYSSGNVGIPDGFHRIAAYILSGRTSIRGYAIGTPPKS